MKKQIEEKKLSNTHEIMLWASVRYFIGRSSIVSTTFPSDIVSDILPNMNDAQKEMLHDEIKRCIENVRDHLTFSTDLDLWEKLMNYLDINNKYEIITKEDDKVECFKWNDKYVPYDIYLKNSSLDSYVNPDMIKLITYLK